MPSACRLTQLFGKMASGQAPGRDRRAQTRQRPPHASCGRGHRIRRGTPLAAPARPGPSLEAIARLRLRIPAEACGPHHQHGVGCLAPRSRGRAPALPILPHPGDDASCRPSSHSCGRHGGGPGLSDGPGHCGNPLLRTNLIKDRLHSPSARVSHPTMPPVSLATLRKGARGVVMDVRGRRPEPRRRSPVHRQPAPARTRVRAGRTDRGDRGDLAGRRSDCGAPRQHHVRAATA